MCRTQCVLALVVLYVGLSHSWDMTVFQDEVIAFYTNGFNTDAVFLSSPNNNVSAITYDEVHNMILFVNKQHNYDAICGFNILSHSDINCFIKRNGSNIHDLAFDPVTELLFFTDTNDKSINSISLKYHKSLNNVYGDVFIESNGRIPRNIAVDSCRGYIYWTNTDTYNKFMERARLDGSERQLVYRGMHLASWAIDPQNNKVYYLEDSKTTNNAYLIKQNLKPEPRNGFKAEIVYSFRQILSVPYELTISEEYIYWMNNSVSFKTVWQIPKDAVTPIEPKEFLKFYISKPLGIVAYNKFRRHQDCEALSSLISTSTVTISPNIQHTTQKQRLTDTDQAIYTEETLGAEQIVEYTTEVEATSIQGMKVSETSLYNCTPGHTGEPCDISVCENYCLQGKCSFNSEGLPECRCNRGYSGKRCEDYACHNYCLNNGSCSLNEDADEPVCQCVERHEGVRCEAVKTDTFTSAPTYESSGRNLTLADLLSNWRKRTAKISVIVEV